MTDSDDETQPHATPDPADPSAPFQPVPPVPPTGGGAVTPVPPVDVPPVAVDAPGLVAGPEPVAPDPERLAADPDRPADSGWREPAWYPPRDRSRHPSAFAIVIGLILIAIGVYAFLDRTLGLTLPRIQWSSLWPIALIVLGGLILLRSFKRKT